MTATATYLYAITRPIPAAAVTGLRGVDGTAVRVVEHGDLTALVSTVGLADWGEQPLTEHLEDPRWLARTAHEHDEVVRAAWRITTTMPLRMATVCHDDDAVHDRLEAVRELAAAALPELDGRDEWGVKMFAIAPSDSQAAPPQAVSGAAYLRQRRRELSDRDSLMESAAHDAGEAFARLSKVAAASRRHRIQDRGLSGAAHPMVLNAAFLVARQEQDAFETLVADVADHCPPDGVVLTGPWPPYSFVPTENS